jgi:hypothetical protein
MTTTALFTTAELDSQIAAYKAALLALATAAEYTIDVGGQRTTVRKVDLPEIRNTLAWLQGQRVGNDVGAGPQFLRPWVTR